MSKLTSRDFVKMDLPQPLPRKGTETKLHHRRVRGVRKYLPQPLPRKGTETRAFMIWSFLTH